MVTKIIIDDELEISVDLSTEFPITYNFPSKGLHSVKYITDDGELPSFKNCVNLLNVTIPKNATKITEGTFDNCLKLTNITIPENIKTLDLKAFNNCENLSLIDISSSETIVENEDLKGEYSISVPDSYASENPEMYLVKNGEATIWVKYNITNTTDNTRIIFDTTNLIYELIVDSDSNTILTWDATIDSDNPWKAYQFEKTGTFYGKYIFNTTMLNGFEFWNTDAAVEIDMTDNITYIGGCFIASSNIEKIHLSNTLVELGGSALMTGSKLTSITLPETLTTVGDYALHLSGVTELTIPESLVNVGGSLLYTSQVKVPIHNSKVLIYYPTNLTATEYTIPDGIETVAGGAFYENNYIETLNIPESCKSFGGCATMYKLKTIKVPNASTSVFSANHDTALTEIDLGEGTTTIGAQGLGYCNSLQKVILRCPTLVVDTSSYYGSAFYQLNTNLFDLYVPSDLISDYLQSSWSRYAKSINAIEE